MVGLCLEKLKMLNIYKEYIKKLKSLLPKDFDYKVYLELNPDLIKENVKTEELALQHYLSFGMNEKRRYKKIIEIDEDFDENFYLDEYPDVENYHSHIHIPLKERLFHHYHNFGREEGRSKNKKEKNGIFYKESILEKINEKKLINPKNVLECICLLTTSKEIKNHNYNKFIDQLTKTKNYSKKIDFKIIVNNFCKPETEKIESFFNIEIINLKLKPDEDIYKTSIDGKMPKYGLKSGPNLSFFKAIDICKKYNTTLMLETDCILAEDWFERIDNYVNNSNGFLVSGAVYDGNVLSNSGSLLCTHINGGSALYATGNEILQKLIESLKIFMEIQIKNKMRGLAYDCALKMMIDQNLNNMKSSLKTKETWKFVNRNYVSNKLIFNYCLPQDSSVDTNEIKTKYNYAILHKK